MRLDQIHPFSGPLSCLISGLFALLLCLPVQAAETAVADAPLLLTGVVQSMDAEGIYTPYSNTSPTVLRYYVEEGTRVKPGDVLVRTDPGQALAQIRQLELQIDQAQARTAKEIAELHVAALDAELAKVDAKAAADKAAVDAALPREFLSALDYDRYQGEQERAQRELKLKQKEAVDAERAVQRRQHDAKLEIDRLQAALDFQKAQAAVSEQVATRDGVVVHGMNPRSGDRVDEGSSVHVGAKIGEVVGDGGLAVRAFALEPDREGLSIGRAVSVVFDAFPARRISGKVSRIAGAPEEKPEWGEGRYFSVDIVLEPNQLPLQPGMSARVAVMHAGELVETGPVQAPSRIDATGQLEAEDTALLVPPAIPNMWNLSISKLTADGSLVKKGQVVLQFDGNQLQQDLLAKQAELAEKNTQKEQLRLALAEREQNEILRTAEARSVLEKAERKATQPAELLRGVDYQKLVIDKALARTRMALTEQREAAAAEQRRQEWRLISFEAEQLGNEVTEIQQSMQDLNVQAPRDGVMLHRSSRGGEKFDVGTMVWMGQTIAEIPDLASLSVRAQVDERYLAWLRLGAAARLSVEGSAGRSLSGSVSQIGSVVHAKSPNQPVPVVDVLIRLDDADAAAGLKPGQPVRVSIEVKAAAQLAATGDQP